MSSNSFFIKWVGLTQNVKKKNHFELRLLLAARRSNLPCAVSLPRHHLLLLLSCIVAGALEGEGSGGVRSQGGGGEDHVVARKNQPHSYL